MSSGNSSVAVETVLGPLGVKRSGTGAPALLWHSLFVDSSTFAGIAQELGRQHELFMVDGPGHGESPGPGMRYSLEHCAMAAAQILNALGIEGPVVFADKFAPRCRTLTTIGTPPYPLTAPMLASRDDPLLDPGEAECAARSVVGGRLEWVSGAGHVAPLLLAPQEVTQHILRFWAEH